MSTEQISAVEEGDFSFGDGSVVDTVTATWTVTGAEVKQTESEKGKGTQHVLKFESPDFPYPIFIRQFVEYAPADVTKDLSWLKRARGVLKQISKAATGTDGYSLNPNSEKYIVGKQVIATTKEDQDGRATLGRFKKVG